MFITDSDIRHIRRKHGANEERRGQQSIVPNDFALIPKVLNESDACDHADGQGGQQEVPREKGDRGTAYLVTAQRGKGKLDAEGASVGCFVLAAIGSLGPKSETTPTIRAL